MSRRIRVLQLTGNTAGGSAEHVLQLSTLLPADRFDVTVAFAGGGPLDDELRATGLRVLDYAPDHGAGRYRQALPRGPVDLLRQFRRVHRDIRQHRYDVVHTHTSVAGVIGRVAAWACGTPVRVHMVHAYAGHDAVPEPRRTVFTLVERALGRLTTHHVTGSDFSRDVGVRRRVFAPGDATVIHPSTRAQPRDPGPGDRARLRAEFGLPEDTPLVALVGRIEEQKGVDHLVAITPRLMAAVPGVHVLVVGDGTGRGAVEQLAAELGVADRVHVTGWRSDLAELMRAIDVLALPSRWEAFGIVNLEAMAAAKPVVAFAVEGVPEVVAHGETGLLSPAGDRDALLQDLVRVLTDPALAARLGKAGRRRFAERFAPDRMVAAHVDLYEELLAAACARRRVITWPGRRRPGRAGRTSGRGPRPGSGPG